MIELGLWSAVLIGVLLVHELGHVIAARWVGFPVRTISVGFGPKLFGITDRHGALWALRLFPFGASCDVHGMSVNQAAGNHPFSRNQLYKEVLIYSAGPLFNIALAAAAFVAEAIFCGGVDLSRLNPYLAGWPEVILVIAGLSLSVGVFNLLPALPLDGGRILVLGIDLLRGRRTSVRIEQGASIVGLALLLALSVSLLIYAVML